MYFSEIFKKYHCRILLFLLIFIYTADCRCAAYPKKVMSGYNPVFIEAVVSPYDRQSISLNRLLYIISNRFGSKVTVKFYFAVEYDSANDKFTASGGIKELEEIYRRGHILRYNRKNFWDYAIARDQNIYNPDWIPEANFAGFGDSEIKSMAAASSDSRVKSLLLESHNFIKEENLEPGTYLFIAGKKFEKWSSRLSETAAYINGLLPEEDRIKNMPIYPGKPDKEITVLAVANPYGTGSNIGIGRSLLGTDLLAVKMEIINYEDDFGRKLMKKEKLTFLPTFLVKKNDVKREEKLSQLNVAGLLVPSVSSQYYVIPSTFVVYGFYPFNPVRNNELTVFVMSHCPWGSATMLQLLREKNRSLSSISDITVKFRYIVESSTYPAVSLTDFKAFNGLPEVEENIRQIIIQKYYPEKFLDYLEARSSDVSSTLVYKAFEKASIPEQDVKDKIETEGVKLLCIEAELCRKFGISASPSFLWENRYLLDLDEFKLLPRFRRLNISVKGSCR
ncbi:MAG: hypothetical protein BWY26_00880 [Elusimicrobia bacterium ADurb.Bin231]|nr:MAG: hypothetical protein BWY26_00880 [Elusimicrobia bacterium ADurb.Bin231]